MNEKVTVEIERLSFGSAAVAHTQEGKTLFVEGGCPGDTALVEIFEEKKSFSRAHIVELIEKSEKRVEPEYLVEASRAPWVHIERTYQLEAKRELVCDSLVRIGKFEDTRVSELVASCEAPSSAWHYRNKIELAVKKRGRKLELGSRDDKGEFISMDEDPLFDTKNKKLLDSLRGALSYLLGAEAEDLLRVQLRNSSKTGELELALWTRPGAFPRTQAKRVLEDALPLTSLVRVITSDDVATRKVKRVERLSGAGNWTERLLDRPYKVSAPSFFQVNTKGAEALITRALSLLGDTRTQVGIDLFCGVGSFTLPLAKQSDFIAAVEAYGPAVRDLERNISLSGLDNVDALGGDALQEFPEMDADYILVDPPRAGCGQELVEKLSSSLAERIIYVSCDPATLARDLAHFEYLGNFKLKAVYPLDLFPQSYHVESVSLLERTN